MRRLSNRLARWALGVAFAIIAFVIERRVIRAIQKGQMGPKTAPATQALSGTRTAEGVEVTPEA
jgi:hypothetical protein